MLVDQDRSTTLEIFVQNLTFSHVPSNPSVEPSLVDISLALPKGSRTVLIGANGGKSFFSSFRHELVSWKAR